MKMLVTALLGSLLLITSCKKESDPEPAPLVPAQSAEVSVAATYYDNTPAQGLHYLAYSPAASQYSDRLELLFRDDFGREALTLVFAKSKQKAGWVGTYIVAAQPDPGQGDVQFSYVRRLNDNYSNSFGSNTNALSEGSVVITAYDASRKVLSGTFTLHIKKAKDPFRFTSAFPGSASDARADADIKLYGTFLEVPIL